VWKGSFDLRFEKGAIFWHGWRDNANPFRTGPSLNVGSDGWLVANDRRLLQLPTGQWIHFEVTCGLGEKACGNYDLLVQVSGTEARVFKDLPCNPEFKALYWFGFVSDAVDSSVFYLDNVEIVPVQ
jgi:hypothetical protein